MWPYHARDTKCRKMSCWILHTSISRKWDTENPVSRCLFTPIMTRRIPIFISSLREWHLMEERFSTAMSADVLRKSLTAFLGMTGRKKRKMTLICPSSTHSLHLPSSRQLWFPWDMKSIRKKGMYSSSMVERFRRKFLLLK